MSTEPERDLAALDARLAHLPQWQPPADFAARLAAAATRQGLAPAITAQPAPGWAWRRFLHHLPLPLGMGLTLWLLATLPWPKAVSDPLFPWIVAAGAALTGLVLTWRLLRTP